MERLLHTWKGRPLPGEKLKGHNRCGKMWRKPKGESLKVKKNMWTETEVEEKEE